MEDIIKLVRSLEDSTLLIDDITKTVKHEINMREGWCCNAMLAPMAASLIAPMASSFIQFVASLLINVISWKSIKKAATQMMDVLGKGIKGAGTGYKNMNHVDKNC